MPITEEEAEAGRRVILPSYITAMRTELATHMSLTCHHLVLMPPDQAPWQHWMTQLKQGSSWDKSIRLGKLKGK